MNPAKVTDLDYINFLVASPKIFSHDHTMFSGIGVSLFSRLGGMRALMPGFTRILIRPYIPHGLAWVETSLRTAHGRIESSWHRNGARLEVDVTVPPGTTAVIEVPKRPALQAGSPGESAGGEQRERYEVGPGSYQFRRQATDGSNDLWDTCPRLKRT